MTKILGIDEAAKGPIIGPLIISGVVINGDPDKRLKNIKVEDSKRLSEKERKESYEEIIDKVEDYQILKVTPQEINKAMRSSESNMNILEAEKIAEIIDKTNADEAIIDCPSKNIQAYTKKIKNRISKDDISINLEHKAEENTVVAAASILAKVTRDSEIEEIKERIGEETGSGYLTDPKTQEFLEEYHDEHDNLFRKMWKPYQKLKSKKSNKKIDDFQEESSEEKQ